MKTIAMVRVSAIYAHIKKIRKQSLSWAFPIVLPLIKATRTISTPLIPLKEQPTGNSRGFIIPHIKINIKTIALALIIGKIAVLALGLILGLLL